MMRFRHLFEIRPTTTVSAENKKSFLPSESRTSALFSLKRENSRGQSVIHFETDLVFGFRENFLRKPKTKSE
jgi:hypothetical protein